MSKEKATWNTRASGPATRGEQATVLEDLYYGNINPNERYFDSTSRYARCAETVTQSEEKLIAFLTASKSEDGLCWLSQLTDAQGEINQLSVLEEFIAGFRLGAAIMLDTFILPAKSNRRKS